MIKSIWVCTDGSPHGNVACDYALYLGKTLQARLHGLHVLDSRMYEGPLIADIAGGLGMEPFRDQWSLFQALMQEKGRAIVEALEAKAREQGLTISVKTRTGHPVWVILEEEDQAELVILGRQGLHARWNEPHLGSIVERVIRHSDNPCLVTPDTFRPINRILAAYDGSAHAGKALHQAIELAQQLNAELFLLSVADTDSLEDARARLEEAMQRAQDHEIRTVPLLVETDEPVSETVLETAAEQNCELIVMGAYGHSRIREWILGSTTQTVLATTTLPVLLVR